MKTGGFSHLGITLAISLGFLITFGTFAFSLRRITAKAPFVGTCSAVISAACHPPKEDTDAAMKMVQWGVLPLDASEEWQGRHCCITSMEVEQPETGVTYE